MFLGEGEVKMRVFIKMMISEVSLSEGKRRGFVWI
jgi:hypothetical protein